MELILNGIPQKIDTSNCANLAELVVVAEQIDAEVDSLVVGIEVDGEELSSDELAALESRIIEDVSRVSIRMRSRRAVAFSVLEQGAEYTGRISNAILATVQHFRTGRSDLGSAELADVTDSLTVLTGITLSVAGVLGDETESLVTVQGEVLPWLEALIQAQEEQDPIRIGDLLEYEIMPRVAEWGAIMRSLVTAEKSGYASNPGTRSN